MLEQEWETSLLIKSHFLKEQYVQIIQEFFPGCVNLDEFMAMFSQTFHEYQESNRRKMDPDSIRERKISCSSAAALLGVWWSIQFPQSLPIFLIEAKIDRTASKTTAHVSVVLPPPQGVSIYEAILAFTDQRAMRNDLHIIDWTSHSSMKPTNPNCSYPVYPLTGLDSYLRNRLQILGLLSKYSTKNPVHG